MDSKAFKSTVTDKEDCKSKIRVEPIKEESNNVASELVIDIPEDVADKLTGGPKFSRGYVRYRVPSGVEVLFFDAELWETFRSIGTEMIVTKKGRRVFPVPSYIITGLHPERLYNIFIKITPVDNAKHKFLNGVWVQHQENAHTPLNLFEERSTYLHPSSPNTGAHWMSELIAFSSLKISNNVGAQSSIVLQSMRKYQMSLVISPQFEARHSGDIIIPQAETQFVAVTQYQNDKITQMKIEHNPFATSFRIKKSNTISQDDNDSVAGESSSEDCTEHLPSMSTHTGYRGVDWAPRPYLMLPNLRNSSPDPTTAAPWPTSYTHKDKMRFPPLHTGQMVPNPVASMFPMFHYTNSAFQNAYPTPSILGFQQLHNSEHPATQLRRERTSDNGPDSGDDESISPAKKPLLMEQPESVVALMSPSHDGPQHKLNGGTQRSQYLATRSTFSRLDGQFDVTMNDAFRQKGPLNEDQVPNLSLSCPRPEVTLKHKDVWATTQEIVVSKEGRPMYPHLEVAVSNLVPDRLYSCHLELVFATPWFYEYKQGEWTPSTKAKVQPVPVSEPSCSEPWYQHSENPKPGRHWESQGISFEGLRLATCRQGKNKIKVQLRRQYFPVLTMMTEHMSWQYPLRVAMFVTVSIDRNNLSRPIEPPFQQNSHDLAFYLNLRELKTNPNRPSFGRKQQSPKKTKSLPEDVGISEHSQQPSYLSHP